MTYQEWKDGTNIDRKIRLLIDKFITDKDPNKDLFQYIENEKLDEFETGYFWGLTTAIIQTCDLKIEDIRPMYI